MPNPPSKQSLETKNIEPVVSWKLIDRGRTFSPITNVCQLCTREAYYILFHPDSASLNSRSELYSACRHKKSKLLFPPEKTPKKKSPGT